ncbi:hypothetical protein I553_0958 [Mycobacterium xenopi 4042]|uniref:Uncharacterized protein n=1 Tax=Mycobacterium xenopi 4042 TaxID=1299334 RepID=X7ZB42_MYCXE|nr:hypothetical protein I553_0958 [Mycobacterium xenopi 4042]
MRHPQPRRAHRLGGIRPPTGARRRHCAQRCYHEVLTARANAVRDRLGGSRRAKRVRTSADREEYGGGRRPSAAMTSDDLGR